MTPQMAHTTVQLCIAFMGIVMIFGLIASYVDMANDTKPSNKWIWELTITISVSLLLLAVTIEIQNTYL